MKRAGRGHVENGLTTTGPGELGIRCWACPLPGVNVAENWREITPQEKMYVFHIGSIVVADPKHRFLYMLVIAIDANF